MLADVGVAFEISSKRVRIRLRQNLPDNISDKVPIDDQFVLGWERINCRLASLLRAQLTLFMPDVSTRLLGRTNAISS